MIAASVPRTRRSPSRLAAAFGLIALCTLAAAPARAAEKAVIIPPPAVDATREGTTATAVFAGGCFWGVQGVFQHVTGVKNAVSGYSGGERETAAYEAVSSGSTGHAEAVEITYDPAKVSPDHGTQYRSEIFAATPEQAEVAKAYVAQLNKAGVYGGTIVTAVSGLKAFYPAEAYHQDFLTLNPSYPYIVYNDMPKIENLKALFPSAYAEKPVLVSQAKG